MPDGEEQVAATSEGRQMRADARRNREHLVVVAREAFEELGLEVAMDVIARRARVGSGTLYRHFPTREALIAATYESDVVALTRSARDLAERCGPAQALERWVREHLLPTQEQRGVAATLKDALCAAPTDFLRCKLDFNAAADELVAAAQRVGRVRSDVAAGDVLRLAHGIAVSSEDAPEARERMLTIMFDGLQPR